MGIHWDWLKWRQRITRLGKQLNKWAISRPLSRYTLREVNMLIFGLKQEPITRSVQLAYFLATAFSQVCLSTAEVIIGPYSSVAENYIVYWGKCIHYYVLALMFLRYSVLYFKVITSCLLYSHFALLSILPFSEHFPFFKFYFSLPLLTLFWLKNHLFFFYHTSYSTKLRVVLKINARLIFPIHLLTFLRPIHCIPGYRN